MSELFYDEPSFAGAGAGQGRRNAAHDAPLFHSFAATSALAWSLTADTVERLPSGEVPLAVVVPEPSYFRKLAIKWGHAPARCRIVLRGGA